MFKPIKKMMLPLSPVMSSASLLAQGSLPAVESNHSIYAGEMNSDQARSMIDRNSKLSPLSDSQIRKNLGYPAQVAGGINRARLIHILKTDRELPGEGESMFSSTFGQQLITRASAGAATSASLESSVQAGLVLNMVDKLRLDPKELADLKKFAPQVLTNLRSYKVESDNLRADYKIALDAASKFAK